MRRHVFLQNQAILAAVAILVLFAAGCTTRGAAPSAVEPVAIPVTQHPEIERVLSKHCPSLETATRGELIDAVAMAADLYQVDRNLVLAVITAESRCRNRARSHAGAVGLMQLMPGTARWVGVVDAEHKWDNIFGGTQYLRYLMELFDGDLTLTIAAYNAGPTAVRRYGGVPPYRETKVYLRRVLHYYNEYRRAE
ncbi:MAG: lytic transglycosylase domain-containing protein [Bdellovibrionales bacterium]|nr:lytic transglycosylase domain-containing protein [Bdellovibrionales bacterium]